MLKPFLQAGALALAIAAAAAAHAQSAPAASPLPTFAQLEAAGATIGEVVVRTLDIFDTDDPAENNWLFRTANRLHINTRESVVRQALLFQPGERLRAATIDETERILRSGRNFSDVHLRPIAVRGNVVDIEVRTRDAWSLDFGVSFSRQGGSSTSSANIKEYNLLGTGTSLFAGRRNDVDRSGNEFEISNDRAFGTWTQVTVGHARNDDGDRNAVSVVRPFYALDARWAAGVSWARNDRIEANYVTGDIESEYRYKEERAEVFGGFSRGLVGDWVNRYSAGLRLQDDKYANEPGRVAPAALALDQKLVYPFVRLEAVEDRFERKENRNQMGRPEFFALGLRSYLDIGHAGTALGSSRDSWVYSAGVSRGYELPADQTILAQAALKGQFAGGRVERQQVGGQVQYYLPHYRRLLFYASASADVLTNPGPSDALLLGGDNGLRGYPLRYHAGNRRALLTLEERAFSDIYLWRLFRLGAAGFIDVGRAWGGPYENRSNAGWISSVGVGLRIFNVRSAFSNVLHVDLSVPLDPDTTVKRVQFGVKTRASF
jgi:outer membrane protein assembly factor BamA